MFLVSSARDERLCMMRREFGTSKGLRTVGWHRDMVSADIHWSFGQGATLGASVSIRRVVFVVIYCVRSVIVVVVIELFVSSLYCSHPCLHCLILSSLSASAWSRHSNCRHTGCSIVSPMPIFPSPSSCCHCFLEGGGTSL